MAIRDDFEVVASQVRTVVQRFALGLLVIASFGAMLVGKADTVLVEHARVLALDLASPVLEAIARPVAAANRTIADLKEFASLREENAACVRKCPPAGLADRRGDWRTKTSVCAASPISAKARGLFITAASWATASAPCGRCSMSGARPASPRGRRW
jgi:predicted metal-binding membrane protein